MTTTKTKPRVTSFAPQFLVDDLDRSIAYYRKLGFTFGEPWEGFYAIGLLDGLELHLKEAPKSDEKRRFRRAYRFRGKPELDAEPVRFSRDGTDRAIGDGFVGCGKINQALGSRGVSEKSFPR